MGPSASSLVGQQIGSYRIVGLLGEGGHGEVYRATDAELQRDVALKILPPAVTADLRRRERLLAEAKTLGALNHPNIVHVHRVGTVDGLSFIDSELIEGISLRDEASHAPLPIKRLLAIGAQVADGLAAAHEAGVVHHDIKPENVMIGRDGRPRIVDFGLANAVLSADDPSEDWTRELAATEPIRGTVPYMSPEQAHGSAADF